MMEVFIQLEHRQAWGRMLELVVHKQEPYGPCQCGYSQNNALHVPHNHHATSTEIIKIH